MCILHRICVSVSAVLLGILTPAQSTADLPEKLKQEVESAKSKYAEAYKAADKKLLETFDTEMANVRKQPGLKAEERQQLIEAIGIEKAAFEKAGAIPFSLRMRTATISYLTRISDMQRPVAAIYDKAIEYSTKNKDDEGSAKLVTEKRMFLKPRTIAIWDCKGINWKGGMIYHLYADGTSRINNESHTSTWTFIKDKLVVKNPAPNAPPGGWIDTFTFEPLGQLFTASNQKGGKFSGKWIGPK